MYVPVWVIPILLTVGVFGWAAVSAEHNGGGYGAGAFEGVMTVVLTLLIWLAFFAAMFFFGGA